MALPSPSSPPALQTGKAQQQSTAGCALTRDCDGLIDVAHQRFEQTAYELLAFARQAARLSSDAGGIGAGKLVQLVSTARRLVITTTGSAS